MAAAGSVLGWHSCSLLLFLDAVCKVLAVAAFSVQQVCSWCPGELRNSSEVVSFCHSNPELNLKERCCLRREGDSDVIAGLDLWNCSLTHLETELKNVNTAVVLDLAANPLQNVSSSFFQGFINLQYLALPLALDCPGGNASWEDISVDTNERICRQQKDSCNNTAQQNWPAVSPDLNPMKNLWKELKSAIDKRNPENIHELEQIPIEEWKKLPADRCTKPIDDYKKHLEAVITAKGCAAKY